MCGGIWEVQGKRGVYRIIWGDIGETSHLEGLGIEKMILLNFFQEIEWSGEIDKSCLAEWSIYGLL